MGKMRNILLIVAVLQISLLLFATPGSEISDTTLATGQNQSMSLTRILLQPQNWNSNPLWSYLGVVLMGVGLAGVIIGSIFIKTDFPVYAGIALVFLSFGVSIFNFWQYMAAQGVWGEASFPIIALLMVPLVIMFIIAIFDYARGRD